MKNKLLIVILILFCSILSFALEGRVITAAADPWPPFVDPKNPKEGFSMEIIRAAYQTQGYVVKMEYVPWARALRGVINGEYDILPDAWYTEERAKEMLFSDAYAVNEIKFITLKDSNIQYSGLESISDKTVGVVRGYGYGDKFAKFNDINRSEVNDFIQNIKRLLFERIDLTLEDEIVARVRIAQEDPNLLNKIQFLDPPLSSNKLYITTGYKNPDHKEIIEAFNNGLAEIKSNGTFDEILKDYGF